MSEENPSPIPQIVAETITHQFSRMRSSVSIQEATKIAAETNELLNQISPEQAAILFGELYFKKTEIETQYAQDIISQYNKLTSIADSPFSEYNYEIENADSNRDAAKLLARRVNESVTVVQEEILQETIGKKGVDRMLELADINQAIGIVSAHLSPTAQ